MVRIRTFRVSLAVGVVVGMLALLSSAPYAGEGETKKSDSTRVTSAVPVIRTGGIKLEASENSEPWVDLGAIIENVKGGIKVTQTIPLPEDFAPVVSLEVGTLIKTFQNKPVTTAADLIAQYDKLKSGDTAAITFELKGKTGMIKFAKPKRAGNIMMIKK
jgi:PDZ domain-containing secreted protein